MRKSYKYEIILFYFQKVLKNSLDPDPDSGVFWIRIEIFGWIRIRVQWIRISNTGSKCLFLCSPHQITCFPRWTANLWLSRTRSVPGGSPWTSFQAIRLHLYSGVENPQHCNADSDNQMLNNSDADYKKLPVLDSAQKYVFSFLKKIKLTSVHSITLYWREISCLISFLAWSNCFCKINPPYSFNTHTW